jgi:hypothetical protein
VERRCGAHIRDCHACTTCMKTLTHESRYTRPYAPPGSTIRISTACEGQCQQAGGGGICVCVCVCVQGGNDLRAHRIHMHPLTYIFALTRSHTCTLHIHTYKLHIHPFTKEFTHTHTTQTTRTHAHTHNHTHACTRGCYIFRTSTGTPACGHPWSTFPTMTSGLSLAMDRRHGHPRSFEHIVHDWLRLERTCALACVCVGGWVGVHAHNCVCVCVCTTKTAPNHTHTAHTHHTHHACRHRQGDTDTHRHRYTVERHQCGVILRSLTLDSNRDCKLLHT